MSTRTEAIHKVADVDPEPREDALPEFYDRSSLTGDYMVMIPDQTPEDFEKYAPESRFCHYIDGVIYLPSPVSDRHQEQVIFLIDMLNGFRLARKECGAVMTGPAVLRISDQRKPEPDIFVRPPAPAKRTHPKALLVVEVFSPSTRTLDRGLKLDVYRDARIPEIWLVDSRNRQMIVERRGPKRYRRDEMSDGYLRSTSIPGFWIDVAWLWESPLPNPRLCLERILAGPPE